jgi:hypothetical protein
LESDKYHTLTAAETQYDKTLLQRQIDAMDKQMRLPRRFAPRNDKAGEKLAMTGGWCFAPLAMTGWWYMPLAMTRRGKEVAMTWRVG